MTLGQKSSFAFVELSDSEPFLKPIILTLVPQSAYMVFRQIQENINGDFF